MLNKGPSAVIIPAFNEGPRIGAVIEAVQTANPEYVRTDEMIVVDNNSTDETAKIAESLGAFVVPCSEQGKGPAITRGVEEARNIGASILTYLDADLVNLRGTHIDSLVAPIMNGSALMSIGYLGGRNQFLKDTVYRHWAMFSGQRSLPIEVWDRLSARDLKAFRVEAALNSLFRNSGRGNEIVRIELDGVTHTGKFEKYKAIRGLMQYASVQLSAVYGLTTRSSL